MKLERLVSEIIKKFMKIVQHYSVSNLLIVYPSQGDANWVGSKSGSHEVVHEIDHEMRGKKYLEVSPLSLM